MRRFVVITAFAAEPFRVAGEFNTPSEAGMYIDGHGDEFEGNNPILVDRETGACFLSYSPQSAERALAEAATKVPTTFDKTMEFVVWHESGNVENIARLGDPIIGKLKLN